MAGTRLADIASRLARYFGTTPHLWLNMQASYNLYVEPISQDNSTIKPRAA